MRGSVSTLLLLLHNNKEETGILGESCSLPSKLEASRGAKSSLAALLGGDAVDSIWRKYLCMCARWRHGVDCTIETAADLC